MILITKDYIKALSIEQRMALIDMVWEVTDDENPHWKDLRSEEEILAEHDEAESTEAPPAKN